MKKDSSETEQLKRTIMKRKHLKKEPPEEKYRSETGQSRKGTIWIISILEKGNLKKDNSEKQTSGNVSYEKGKSIKENQYWK